MDDLVGLQLGTYQIVARLGQGGMATVYKAYQPSVDRYVALKFLPEALAKSPEFRKRFQREARVLARLQHPHILPVFDFGQTEEHTFLVMPYLESGSLAGVLSGEPLALSFAISVVEQVADALDYAASQGVVHRDVKPSNILIDARGNCLLSDFGIAKILDFGNSRPLETATGLTMAGGMLGTPAYMSPEQGRGEVVNLQSDLYSLGVVLYEMLTGRVPFHAETPIGVIVQHIQDPLPPPTSINPRLSTAVEQVIVRALAKERAHRFATGSDLARALQQANSGSVPGTLATAQTLPPGSASQIEAASAADFETIVPSPGTIETAPLVWREPATQIQPASTAGAKPASPPPTAPVTTPLVPTGPATQGQLAPAADREYLLPTREASRRPPVRTYLIWLVSGAICLLAACASLPVLRLIWPRAAATQAMPTTTQAATTAPLPSTMPAPAPTVTRLAATSAPPATHTPEAIPTRLAFQAVSLGPIENASLSEDFVAPPVGSQVFGDVPFELDGGAFKSQAGPSPNIDYPEAARLEVELPRPKSVSVLLGAGNGFFQWSGVEIGRITLELAEGAPVTVVLVLGQNIREWHAGENLAAAGTEITEAWRGPIAGHPELVGWLDMLTIELPAAACDDVLTAIEFSDTSQITLRSADPALTIAGVSVAFCPNV